MNEILLAIFIEKKIIRFYEWHWTWTRKILLKKTEKIIHSNDQPYVMIVANKIPNNNNKSIENGFVCWKEKILH